MNDKALREALAVLRSDMQVHQADIIERSNNQKGRARNRTRRYSAAMEKFIRFIDAALASQPEQAIPIGNGPNIMAALDPAEEAGAPHCPNCNIALPDLDYRAECTQASWAVPAREQIAKEIADEFCGGSEAIYEAILCKLLAAGRLVQAAAPSESAGKPTLLLERIRNFVLLDSTETALRNAIVRAFTEAEVDLHTPLVRRSDGR